MFRRLPELLRLKPKCTAILTKLVTLLEVPNDQPKKGKWSECPRQEIAESIQLQLLEVLGSDKDSDKDHGKIAKRNQDTCPRTAMRSPPPPPYAYVALRYLCSVLGHFWVGIDGREDASGEL